MRTVPVTDEMVESYSTTEEKAVKRVFKDAPDMETEPCEAVVHRDQVDGKTAVVSVPWQPDEADLEALLAGGTIMLSTWGGLPAHRLDVVPGTPAPLPAVILPLPDPPAPEPAPELPEFIPADDIAEEDR